MDEGGSVTHQEVLNRRYEAGDPAVDKCQCGRLFTGTIIRKIGRKNRVSEVNKCSQCRRAEKFHASARMVRRDYGVDHSQSVC